MRIFLFFAFLLLLTEVCLSQEVKNDSLANKKSDPADTTFIKNDGDVIDIESYSKRFDPRKALLFSAVFPGAGQFYNKKYWKMPIVYGGFAALIATTMIYNNIYLDYREDYFLLINNPSLQLSPNLSYTKDQLSSGIQQARRQRDFFIILNGIWYFLQMVDAQVDAHLKEFDINPKMQVRIEPLMENSAWTGRNTGIALKIRF